MGSTASGEEPNCADELSPPDSDLYAVFGYNRYQAKVCTISLNQAQQDYEKAYLKQQVLKYNTAASKAIFEYRNAGRGLTQMNLDGLTIREALTKIEERINECHEQRITQFTIVIGSIKQRVDSVPTIHAAMSRLIKAQFVRVHLIKSIYRSPGTQHRDRSSFEHGPDEQYL
jgi:hypothetical protein